MPQRTETSIIDRSYFETNKNLLDASEDEKPAPNADLDKLTTKIPGRVATNFNMAPQDNVKESMVNSNQVCLFA